MLDPLRSSRQTRSLARWAKILGVDRAILYASLGNAASLVLGPVTVLLVSKRLTPELQGFYFTFGSLSLFQFFAELGLGQAVMQFASHEWPRLSMGHGGALEGEPISRAKIAALATGAFAWCRRILLPLWFVLLLAGELLFREKGVLISWRAPWVLLVACFGGNLFLVPVWALLQGCHQIRAFWFYRLIQQIVNALVLWTALIGGGRLWAPGLASSVGLVWSLVFLRHQFPAFLSSLNKTVGAPRDDILWRRDVWPIQWRTAISWMGASFTGLALVPLTFHFVGPVAAGQMGMSVTLAGVLTALATNFVNTKAPILGALVSEKRFVELDTLFAAIFIRSSVVAVLGTIAALVGQRFLIACGFELGRRLLDPVSFALYLGFTVISVVVASLATYLRAFKREPFALLYAFTSGATILTAGAISQRYGLRGVSLGAFLVAGTFQLPLAVMIFRARSSAWKHLATRGLAQ